ncbi:MAG: hypothetical protein ACKVOO_12155 [Burkholderiaceae bacterium]
MQRRHVLRLGLASAAAFSLAGWAVLSVQPGWHNGTFSASARAVFLAVSRGMLDGSLPTEDGARQQALQGLLARLEGLVQSLPAHAQDELSQLLALLGTTAGRRALAGLPVDWPVADVASLQAALQSMRSSRISLRQQAYHALHDLVGGAYFSDASTWPQLGYPGPLKF